MVPLPWLCSSNSMGLEYKVWGSILDQKYLHPMASLTYRNQFCHFFAYDAEPCRNACFQCWLPVGGPSIIRHSAESPPTLQDQWFAIWWSFNTQNKASVHPRRKGFWRVDMWWNGPSSVQIVYGKSQWGTGVVRILYRKGDWVLGLVQIVYTSIRVPYVYNWHDTMYRSRFEHEMKEWTQALYNKFNQWYWWNWSLLWKEEWWMEVVHGRGGNGIMGVTTSQKFFSFMGIPIDFSLCEHSTVNGGWSLWMWFHYLWVFSLFRDICNHAHQLANQILMTF